MNARALLVPAIAVLALSAALCGTYLYYLAQAGHSFNDFFVFWSAARGLWQLPLAQLYDAAGFQQLMRSETLAPIPAMPHPFLYPPTAALLFAPFGLLPFFSCLLLWNGLSLALYLTAVWQVLRPRAALAAAALIAPASVVNLLYGQTGLLTSALILAGFASLQQRPLRGGILLGLLVIKPQIALVPLLVLLISRQRRAILAAALTVLALLAASVLAFGVEAWPAWLHALSDFSAQLPSSSAHLQHSATLYFGLQGIGLGAHAALAAQALAALAVLWTIARVPGGGFAAGPGLMLALIGPFLASPYAQLYDLPTISAVCLLLYDEGRRGRFRKGEPLAMTTAWFLPVLAFVNGWPAGVAVTAVLGTLFVLVLRRSQAPIPC